MDAYVIMYIYSDQDIYLSRLVISVVASIRSVGLLDLFRGPALPDPKPGDPPIVNHGVKVVESLHFVIVAATLPSTVC